VASGTTFVMTSDTLTPGLLRFPVELDLKIARLVDLFSFKVESYARTNAPWTDRTGNARNGLRAVPFHESPIAHGITLFHSVPYGIWLEVRHEGRYAIINKTIESQGAALIAACRGLI
jgi:hypothetical protein